MCTLDAHLEAIRLLSSEEVQNLALQVLPLDQLPLNYLHQPGDDDRTTAYRASRLSCLAWVKSHIFRRGHAKVRLCPFLSAIGRAQDGQYGVRVGAGLS